MQRRAACFQRHQWVTEGQRPAGWTLALCCMTHGCCLIPHLEGLFWQLGREKLGCWLSLHLLEPLPGCYRPGQAGCCLGGNVLCSGFLGSINIVKSQAPPGLQLPSLGCFEPTASRLCWVALMAVCVVEIGLELSKLILYFPSCNALLNFQQNKKQCLLKTREGLWKVS